MGWELKNNLKFIFISKRSEKINIQFVVLNSNVKQF